MSRLVQKELLYNGQCFYNGYFDKEELEKKRGRFYCAFIDFSKDFD